LLDAASEVVWTNVGAQGNRLALDATVPRRRRHQAALAVRGQGSNDAAAVVALEANSVNLDFLAPTLDLRPDPRGALGDRPGVGLAERAGNAPALLAGIGSSSADERRVSRPGGQEGTAAAAVTTFREVKFQQAAAELGRSCGDGVELALA